MGTSGAYGGSNSSAWNAVREAWSDLGADETVDPDPATDATTDPGAQEDPAGYDALGRLLGQALTPGYSPAAPPLLSTLLAHRPGHGSGSGGGGAGSSGGYTGRTGTRTSKVGAQQAARGGAAIGAAYAYRNRDAAALGEYGISLADLDGLSARMRCAKLLDLVLGDAGHPDEAVVRRAAAQQVKRVLDPTADPPSALDALRDLVGEITLQLGLVELKDQILAGRSTAESATRKENGLRSWIRAKLRGLNLGKYGTVSSTDCHRAAHRLWRDAQRLISTT